MKIIGVFVVLFALGGALGCSSRPPAYTGPLEDHRVRVEGRMFAWDVTQEGPDGKLDTEDDIHSENKIILPTGTRLNLELRSKDVLHGFFMPRLGVRKTILPGPVVEQEVLLTQPGNHRFACSEVCGVGHGKMMGILMVLTKEDYKLWLAQQKNKKSLNTGGLEKLDG